MKKFLLPFRHVLLRTLGERHYLKLRRLVLRLIGGLYVAPDPAAVQASNHDEILAGQIKFSVVVPIYNTPEPFLRQCLQSVVEQSYPNWELILVDDKSTAVHVAPILEDLRGRDPRVRVIYRSENGNIAKALNTGFAEASGQYITVLDHDDILHKAALYWMAEAILRHPHVEYLYSDEDKTEARGRRFFGAFLKPGWSPELALQCMYTCHMSVFHREKAMQIGGFRSAFDGAQDYDFMLRFTSKFDQIHHVKKVLYHWREWEGSTAMDLDSKPEAYGRQRMALQELLDGRGEVYEIEDHQLRGHHKISFLPRQTDKVSIVIPTANKSAVVNGKTENHADAVIRSILERSTYENFEIVLAHDGNLTEAQLSAFAEIEKVRLVEYHNATGFNYSEKVNLGAAAATGDFLLLMNDDTRVITANWMERMLGMGQRPGIGAVGAKLLFPDGKVQHSGIWLRGNVAGHIDYGCDRSELGHDLSGLGNRNCIGVTAACQLTPRSAFEELGGYLTEFPLNYNDVDYCLRLHERGLRSVCLNDVELYHHEGGSRTGGQEVAADEIERFLELWRHRVPVDPYLPSNLA